MLSQDVELVDLDADQWANWLALVAPPGLAQRLPVALAFCDGDRLERAVVVGRGPVAVDWRGTHRRALAAARRQAGAAVLVALEPGALAAIAGDIDSRIGSGDDFVATAATAWGAVLRAARRGLVHVDPPLASVLPAPDGDVLQRAFDALVPDGTAIVAYAFDDGASDLFASIIASKEAGDIVFATTHMGIADAIDARHVARDWRSRYRRILDVVDERFDPPSIGVFFERGAVARILGGPPDQLGREIARKHVIVDPAPLWLSALAGGAAVAGTAGAAARSLSRLLPRAARESARAVAGGVARQARAQLRSAGLDPVDLLGFDPVAVWNELRALMRGATR